MAGRDAVDDSTSDPRLRTNAERETVGVAACYVKNRSGDARPEDAFFEVLPSARANIRHRLVRGLLRGQPEGLPTHTIELSTDSRGPDLSGFPERLDGTDILERARPFPDSCSCVAYLPFPASETVLVVPIEAIHGYDRFRLRDPTTLVAPEETSQNPHPVDLVSLLECEGAFSDREQADRIAGELAESVANLALARLADPGERLEDRDSVLEIHRDFSGADPSSALERLAIEGHPFHPGAKIRRGMTPVESLLYATEFTDTVDVRFVAVDRSHALEVDTGESLTHRLLDRFDGLEDALEQSLPDGRYCEEYAVIPIHPWQYTHVIPDRYAHEIRIGRVVPVQGFSWPATPLLNLRTVVPQPPDDDSRALPHLKLAVDVQLTNVVRTVSPQAVSNGPRVTELLARIEERESFDRLAVLAEPAATCYHAPGGPHPDGKEFDDARNLSGLARENPYSHSLVPEDGLPVAVSSLLAESPATDRPTVFDLLERFTERGTGRGVRAFFERYVDVVVPEQLVLMGKYGIALETHPQNTCVVFDGGEPVAMLARDLGGIRVYNDRLAHHDLAFEAYPDSDLEASRPGELYEKLYYALFQNHLTELIATLTRGSDLEESACWTHVREQCVETFDRLRTDSTVPGEWTDRDEAALFEEPTVHKALTAMRLQGNRHEYVTSRVSNPLARSPD